MTDRFDGRILGAGTSSGLRLVVGDWPRSPLGAFTDVMVALPHGERVLLAPDEQVADYVTSTYSFDRVVVVAVELVETGGPRAGGGRSTPSSGSSPGWSWQLDAGPLQVRLGIGTRTGVGRLLRLVPGPLATSPAFATAVDPIARRVFPGVRTKGSAGGGRREYYGARDQHAVTALSGTWQGKDLGGLTDVDPPPDFGFSSTPARPCLTRVVTTVVR